jgi:hypothetical protein
MNGWEYIVLTTDRTGRSDAPFAVRWVNGQEMANWKANLELAVLNGYGRIGWELTTIVGTGFNFKYYMKSPVGLASAPAAPAAPTSTDPNSPNPAG